MILYEKLSKHYSDKELRELLGYNQFSSIKVREKTNLDIIANKIDLHNIDYTLEDFKTDFAYKYSHYKHQDIIFNMFMEGTTPRQVAIKNNFHADHFSEALRDGIGPKSKIWIYVSPYMNFDYEDLKPFEIDTNKERVALFGDKEQLENFKTKYNIEYPVLLNPLNNKWHLAFDGWIFEKIKRFFTT